LTEAPVGVFPGVPYETYAQWPALRSSYLRHFRRSPAHAREEWVRPAEPTPTLTLGNAIHTAILEPALLEQRYAVAPDVDRRFKEGKATWAAFQAEHGHNAVLTARQWDSARGVRDSLWRQPWAPALLTGKGSTELSICWDDPEFPARCKGRIDRFQADFDGLATLVDLKSAEDASLDAFRRDIERYAYGLQAALYLDGMAALAPHFRQWIWVVAEKSPPYACALYVADDEILEEGRRLYRTAIGLHLECERGGHWPGYPPTPQIIGRPPWARRRAESEATTTKKEGDLF
jgi:hypothetical protein